MASLRHSVPYAARDVTVETIEETTLMPRLAFVRRDVD